MSNFNATGVISNRTSQTLTLKDSSLSWGSWSMSPVQTIPPQSSGFIAFVAEGKVLSGTQGQVVYQLDKNTTLTLCFDDPFNSVNNTTGTTVSSADYIVSASVPAHGSTVNFTYIVAKLP